MTIEDGFQSLHLCLDPAPPLLDRRRPLVMAYRQAEDESFVAATAVEIVQFSLSSPEKMKVLGALPPHELGWVRTVDALSHLKYPLEVWHVIATRDRAGLDGALLRTGWVVIGRDADPIQAAHAAEKGSAVILSIVSNFLDYAVVQPVVDPEGLLDFVRPACAPFVQALRRERWHPTISISKKHEMGSDGSIAVWLPWSNRDLAWAPLAENLAGLNSHSALVVRGWCGFAMPDSVIQAAKSDVSRLGMEAQHILNMRADEAVPLTLTTNVPVYQALQNLAAERLWALENGTLAVDVCLASWEPITAGLSAVAASCFSSVTAGTESLIPSTKISFINLPGESLWQVPDFSESPDLLVSAREAPVLFRTAEPPVDERSALPCSRARFLQIRSVASVGTLLGDSERGGKIEEVRITENARFRHVYTVGQTGTGKSTLLLNMVMQDIENGQGVTLIDPHATLIAEVLSRIPITRAEDVIVIDPSDTEQYVGLNPLVLSAKDAPSYIVQRDLVIDELLDTFDALYDLQRTGGPMFETYFRTFLGLVLGTQKPREYTPCLPMLQVVMNSKSLQDKLLERLGLEDPITAETLKQIHEVRGETALREMVPYVTSKLNRFYGPASARRILCQPRTLDFDGIVRNRKIVLAELTPTRIGMDAATLIARQMVLRLSLAAMSRPINPESSPHFIYADEFHIFATGRFARLLSEARKFKLGLVLAHQYTSQLIKRGEHEVLDAVLGNVGTIISFRLGAIDAKLLEDVMAPRAHAEDIIGLPNYVALIRSFDELGNTPVTTRTLPPVSISCSMADEIRRTSRDCHGTSRKVVDSEIAKMIDCLKSLAE